MTTSHIYLLISITICIICILPMMWLPVYKAEPDDAAAAEVMYYNRLAAERTIQAKYEYAAWRMRPVRKSILLPAAPVAPRWFDEPNWYDHVTALDLQHLPEDDHALVWYPDENHWEYIAAQNVGLMASLSNVYLYEDHIELVADEGCGTWHIENDAVEDDHALVWYPDENHWE